MDFSPVLATTKEVPGAIGRVVKTDEEWKAILTPQQYYVLREEGTERPYSNGYHASKDTGTYYCAGCDLALFSSEVKYDSNTGWPSFWQPLSER
ncbi:MAG: peptide-methionine (R)-S-oxide reductase, partial [Nitrospira sp. SB0678_bin_10]|nr:peptide-methionine (R)-S-oxide reductase [Nitrospira sp. SB0678_bin_10]